MQRMMSLATLGVMGWLGYLFLQGGGLSQMANAPRGTQQQRQTYSYQPPNNWNAQQNNTSQQYPNRQPQYQNASTGSPSQSHQQPVTGPSGGQTIRIASFNIQVFGNTKAGKPYVMDTLARIIRNFDVVAIQEIRSKNEYLLPNFVKLINSTGARYDHVIGPRIGYTSIKEQYAYVFNTDRIEVDYNSVYTVGDPDNMLHREPLVATFRTRGVDPAEAFTFTLVNIHTDPDDVPEEMDAMAEVYRVVRRSGLGEDDIILLGDFNANDRQLGRLGKLPGVKPLIEGVATNTKQTKLYDNIIIHKPSTTEYGGRSGVYDVMRVHNLTEKQAMMVSDHFPVWAEFSIYERDYNGRIARRNIQGR